MQPNFQFLKEKNPFKKFADACLEAENSLVVSPATTAILSRRALELAVKWVYSFDSELKVPYQDNLSSLVHDENFRSVVDEEMFALLRYVIKLGNSAVHSNISVDRKAAVLSLHHLHQFVAWIDYCYADEYTAQDFDESLLHKREEKQTHPNELKQLDERLGSKDKRLEEMMSENEQLRLQLTAKRMKHTQSQPFHVDKPTELETRKHYIDLELKLAGWDFAKDVVLELPVTGMPNTTGIGKVDYALYGDNGKIIAVVEAKRTSVDPKDRQQQAKLYADCIEKMFQQRPVIFFTNGYETYLWDDVVYPVRRVSGFYTKEELALMVSRRTMRKPLTNLTINDNITDRYFQKEAILAVAETLINKQRKALLVMATGSGKTRTAVSIVDVLTQDNWVKNVLFLADRKTLLRQAKKSFNTLLPQLTLCNLLDQKDSPEESRMIFSTYPTMMNAIDETKNKADKRLFTVGHFDLIIIDESHRSIYKKYRSIFDYFDGMLLGLTATPRDEIDKNTYEIFNLENGVPTYAYELEQAVKDGYLVDYRTIETKLKFLESGIKYDDLTDEEKEAYEETFDEEEGQYIASSALNKWLFNTNTIDMVLHQLMEKGIKVEGGDKIGKTIIFAQNKDHADKIVERFNALYPHYTNYAQAIYHSVKYNQTLIDEFSDPKNVPHIAVSVDMLDTGVDIPEVVNLVFFKKVRSKSKFWQMIGRGTRLSTDLFGIGLDKTHFLIFDFLGNFEFFRENPKGVEAKMPASLTEKLFDAKVEVIHELQALDYQEEKYITHRKELTGDVVFSIKGLDEENFHVRQQLKYVHRYQHLPNWDSLSTIQVNDIKEHLGSLIVPVQEDEFAKRFDLVMYTIELAKLQTKSATKPVHSVVNTAEALSKLGTIQQIVDKKQIIEKVLTEDFWEQADILELEQVRDALRDLIKFLEKESQKVYYTNFIDEVIETRESEPIYQVNELKSYHKKVHHYLTKHQDHTAIYKLRHNKALTEDDVKALESILWTELGTREDYERDFGDTPVTRLVRQIVGLDPQAANEAFSAFLSAEHLSLKQSKFVKLIVDYVVKNGVMEKRVLQEEPFRTMGSIVELFDDNKEDVRAILGIIDQINENTVEITGA